MAEQHDLIESNRNEADLSQVQYAIGCTVVRWQ